MFNELNADENLTNETINSLAGTVYMLEEEFFKFDNNEGGQSSNNDDADDPDDRPTNPLEYFEI
jgi:hypothetical protein